MPMNRSPDLGQQRAVAVRDALVQALGSIRPGLATRLRWITEDRGLSAVSKVEIYLWAGPTPPPVPPLVRIPSPAEVARGAQPTMLRPRRPARSNPLRPLPGAMEGFGQPVSPAPLGPVFDVQCPYREAVPPLRPVNAELSCARQSLRRSNWPTTPRVRSKRPR